MIAWAAAAVLVMLGQGLVVLLVAWAARVRPFLRFLLLLAVTVLAADVAAAAIGYLAGRFLAEFNRGSEFQRAAVATFAMLSIPALTWITFRVALRIALRPRMKHPGLIPFIGATGLALAGWCGLVFPGVRMSSSKAPVEITRVTVRLPRLPPALEGMTILLVSDVHVGRYISLGEAERRLAPARELHPDLTICAGDVATYHDNRLRAGVAALDEAMPKQERYACLGNHERWINERLATDELKAAGFDVLNNESRRIRLRGGELWLLGVNDPHTDADDLPAALKGVPPGAFTVLLSHSPDIIPKAAARGVDLVLSGHTHGGQIVLPLIGPVSSASRYGPRYAWGLFRVRRTSMFVTRGVGEAAVPFRVYCDPEIALLTLTGSSETRRHVPLPRQEKSR